MPQQWFLLILVCYVAHTAKYLIYLLKSTVVTQLDLWQILESFLSNVHKHFLKIFSTSFFVFNVFFIFIWTFITSMSLASDPGWQKYHGCCQGDISDTASAFLVDRIAAWEDCTKQTDSSADWYQKCCYVQPNTRLPMNTPRPAQLAVHQLRLNCLTSTAFYQAFIDHVVAEAGDSWTSTSVMLNVSAILVNPSTSQMCFKTVRLCRNS